MLDFQPVKIEDRDLILNNIPESASQICDFSFANIFCWSVGENTRIAQKDGFIFLRSRFNGVKSYAFPWGKGDIKTALKIIEKDAKERNADFSFYCLSEEQSEILKEIYGDRLVLHEQRDFFDYVYLREKLATLSGRKYHSKKNHVNSFCKKNNFSYEELNETNLKECLEFSHLWHKSGDRNPKLDEEMLVIEKAFEHFRELHLSGALLRVDGKIVAYALGEAMPDGKTYCTHFEKASPEYLTAYAVINKLFAEKSLGDFEYINREDDAGVENLRKAKTSYHPEHLVKKYYGKIL